LYVILIFLGKIGPFGIALLDDKVDLVMWAKNGARMLSAVLKRIEEVIPDDEVDKKYLWTIIAWMKRLSSLRTLVGQFTLTRKAALEAVLIWLFTMLQESISLALSKT
jgi:hypothetical protein